MQRNLVALVLVLIACALAPLTQPPQPRALTLPDTPPSADPGLTLTLRPGEDLHTATATLTNDGDHPCRYSGVGYVELKPQDADFTYLVDGQPARPLGRCGTGLVTGMLELPPGGQIECPVYLGQFQPREVAVQVEVEVACESLLLTSNTITVSPPKL